MKEYGDDSRQSGPFGDFGDRPALRASTCVFNFQSLGDYERRSKLLLCNRATQKAGLKRGRLESLATIWPGL
jgi:hypothetical protein